MMGVKFFTLFVILLFAAAPSQQKSERVSALGTIARHFQRLYLLAKDRLVSLFIDSVPHINKIAEDLPEIATEIYSIVDTIRDMYNNERFLYLQEDLRNLVMVFLKPFLTTDDQCVMEANQQLVSMTTDSEVATDLREKILKLERMMKETQYLLDIVLDGLMDETEEAIKNGKKCQADRSTSMIVCLHGVIVPWSAAIDALFAQDEDFLDFMTNLKELTTEISSAGGNMKGVIAAILRDVWRSFALCVQEEQRRKMSRRGRYLMLG